MLLVINSKFRIETVSVIGDLPAIIRAQYVFKLSLLTKHNYCGYHKQSNHSTCLSSPYLPNITTVVTANKANAEDIVHPSPSCVKFHEVIAITNVVYFYTFCYCALLHAVP
jgi:hypothetical protein